MCRIAGYFGDPVPLSALLISPPHSLRGQAKAPRELPPGIVGSDGFGVGWFADGSPVPARYRSVLPIWTDDNVDTMSEQVSSSVIVASCRTASQRMPLGMANTPPFLAGHSLLVHNGGISDFHRTVLERLRSELSAGARADVLGNSDTEYLSALLRDRREVSLVEGVRAMLAVLRRCLAGADASAQLNLIVARREELVVVRHAIGDDAPSLHVHVAASGVTAASEPMDADAGWRSLEPGDVVSVSRAAGELSVAWSRVDAR
jgi:gamma-glutamyl hercynylcysteine S-oxide hydrolase